jgi:hypothetical protein
MVERLSDTNQYLFRYLILTNFLQYIEAGAVPAMLLQIANSFGMAPAEQVICYNNTNSCTISVLKYSGGYRWFRINQV